MKSGLPLFLRLLWCTVFHSRGSHARFTWKRFVIFLVFLPFACVEMVLHRIGFLLDALFFRGYRSIEVKEPLFIVGIPRSGTTLLHRILAEDDARFTTLRLWEIIFAPSVTERKILLAVGRLDRALGGPGYRCVKAIERRFFAKFSRMHPFSFFAPEEDGLLLRQVFATPFLLLPFPFPEELWHVVRFDEKMPAADRARVMAFYKACIQRHLYVHGRDRQLLSKNPSFSTMIDALGETFPDGKVVSCVRVPYEAVPSALSLLGGMSDLFGNDPKGYMFRDRLLELLGSYYRHPMKRLPAWPEDRAAHMGYDELTQSPKEAVLALYRRFCYDVSPAFAAKLDIEEEKARTYTSRHVYSLADYGLTPEEVVRDFADVFDYFGFEKRGVAAAGTGREGAAS